jgi:hypothetical protein
LIERAVLVCREQVCTLRYYAILGGQVVRRLTQQILPQRIGADSRGLIGLLALGDAHLRRAHITTCREQSLACCRKQSGEIVRWAAAG